MNEINFGHTCLLLLDSVVVSSGLISLLVVYLLNPLLSSISTIDGLGIVIGNVSSLARSSDGVVMLVDEFDELLSLVVSDLDVLADHVG